MPVLAGPGDVVRPCPAQQIGADTYVIHGSQGVPSVENQGFMNNPAWVVTNDGVVVIDPGSSVQAGRMVMAQLRKTTNRPVTHVFNTHVHGTTGWATRLCWRHGRRPRSSATPT